MDIVAFGIEKVRRRRDDVVVHGYSPESANWGWHSCERPEDVTHGEESVGLKGKASFSIGLYMVAELRLERKPASE